MLNFGINAGNGSVQVLNTLNIKSIVLGLSGNLKDVMLLLKFRLIFFIQF
jgi:hypothetical protein